jgi:hypothetical protein
MMLTIITVNVDLNAAPDRSESKHADVDINSDAIAGIDAYTDVCAR